MSTFYTIHAHDKNTHISASGRAVSRKAAVARADAAVKTGDYDFVRVTCIDKNGRIRTVYLAA